MVNPKPTFVKRPVFLRRALSFRNLLLITILGFAILTFLVKTSPYPYFNFDLAITIFIQKFNPIWFSWLMMLLTLLGNTPEVSILVTSIGAYGYLIGKRKAPLMLVISTVGGYILGQIIKVSINRPRPDPVLIHQIGEFLKTDSFPSGHVLGAVSLYGFLLYITFTQLKKGLLRNILILGNFLMMFLMGLSRIYLGAHWFSDVLGAYLIGFVWLSMVVFVYHRLKPQVKPE